MLQYPEVHWCMLTFKTFSVVLSVKILSLKLFACDRVRQFWSTLVVISVSTGLSGRPQLCVRVPQQQFHLFLCQCESLHGVMSLFVRYIARFQDLKWFS